MMDSIRIMLDDKPNLRKLKEKDKAKYTSLVRTMIQAAEDAADSDRMLPWYDLPEKLHPSLTFEKVTPAILRAFYDVEGLNPDNFSVIGSDLHPLSLFQKQELKNGVGYAKWRKHFGMSEDDEVGPEAITAILRKLLYYAKYIDVKKFGEALMSKQLEAHKALPMDNVEKLPFTPALRYQQERFGELKVGQFWSDIGAFYGGDVPNGYEESASCPACTVGFLRDVKEYIVCESCNIGFKSLGGE